MKRDMELVRKILIALNEHEHGFAPQPFEVEGYTDNHLGYHCLLLSEAGLIEAAKTTSISADSPSAIPIRLTWEGHEFIEDATNDNVWRQTKETVGKIGDASFSVWASVLSQVVIQNLSISN